MASRSFSYQFSGGAGDKVFPLPFEPIGAIVCKVAGATVTGTFAAGFVTLTAALTVPAVVQVTGSTYQAPAAPTAPGTALVALTDSSGGAVSNTIGALSTLSSLTDSSGGTVSTTIAAITDTPTKNAIASINAKLTSALQQLNQQKANVASLTSKINELAAILEASGLAA